MDEQPQNTLEQFKPFKKEFQIYRLLIGLLFCINIFLAVVTNNLYTANQDMKEQLDKHGEVINALGKYHDKLDSRLDDAEYSIYDIDQRTSNNEDMIDELMWYVGY